VKTRFTLLLSLLLLNSIPIAISDSYGCCVWKVKNTATGEEEHIALQTYKSFCELPKKDDKFKDLDYLLNFLKKSGVVSNTKLVESFIESNNPLKGVSQFLSSVCDILSQGEQKALALKYRIANLVLSPVREIRDYLNETQRKIRERLNNLGSLGKLINIEGNIPSVDCSVAGNTMASTDSIVSAIESAIDCVSKGISKSIEWEKKRTEELVKLSKNYQQLIDNSSKLYEDLVKLKSTLFIDKFKCDTNITDITYTKDGLLVPCKLETINITAKTSLDWHISAFNISISYVENNYTVTFKYNNKDMVYLNYTCENNTISDISTTTTDNWINMFNPILDTKSIAELLNNNNIILRVNATLFDGSSASLYSTNITINNCIAQISTRSFKYPVYNISLEANGERIENPHIIGILNISYDTNPDNGIVNLSIGSLIPNNYSNIFKAQYIARKGIWNITESEAWFILEATSSGKTLKLKAFTELRANITNIERLENELSHVGINQLTFIKEKIDEAVKALKESLNISNYSCPALKKVLPKIKRRVLHELYKQINIDEIQKIIGLSDMNISLESCIELTKTNPNDPRYEQLLKECANQTTYYFGENNIDKAYFISKFLAYLYGDIDPILLMVWHY